MSSGAIEPAPGAPQARSKAQEADRMATGQPSDHGDKGRLGTLCDWPALPAVLIAFGALLRLIQYLANRSLWVDEAMLALNIIRKPWSELLHPLDYSQASPVGFVFGEKLVVSAFGPSEFALRLLPLLAALVSLYLFWRLAEKWLDRRAALFALALFAVAEPLAYYAGEAKQYSTDVMWALLLYLALAPVVRDLDRPRGLPALAAVGTAAIWFSFPSAFLLAGVGITLALVLMRRRQWTDLLKISIVGLAWTVSFAVCYFTVLRPVAANPHQQEFWHTEFAPLDSLGATAGWLREAFMHFFQRTLGLTSRFGAASVAALMFLIGLCAMFRADKRKLSLIALPALFCLAAAFLRRYPFEGRLLIFLTPGALLLAGAGASFVAGLKRPLPVRALGLVLLAALYLPTAYSAVAFALPPYGREEARPVIEYMHARQQPGDFVYVHRGAEPAFQYYRDAYGYDFEHWKRGIDSALNRRKYVEELELVAADEGVRRIWLLVSHDRTNEEVFLVHSLDDMATRLDSFEAPGAAAYLYEIADTEPGRE
jgi:4-amino-4-deoxy-L-arabinose transferase-like glycosyltransferase